MSRRVPIKFSSGTTIGPVTVVCVTITVLAFIAMFVILAIYGTENNVDQWVRPLIPVLATIGSVALVYAKAHRVGTQSTHQNEAIITKTENVQSTVENNAEQLNGVLEAKINSAVAHAIADLKLQKGDDQHG
jgi:thiol:disulfide interchange protein